MKNIIHLILIFLVGSMSMYAAQADERNLAVESRTVRYDLVAGLDGCLERVKMRDQMRFRALRIDEKAVAFTHYHDKISIDKASAPGAKVSYVQNFSEGAFYDDVRTCVMTFDVKAGKDAKAVFEKTVTDPAQFCDIWFDCLYPVKEYLLEINVPAQLADKIKFTPRHLPAGSELAKEADDKGNLRYTLALADVAELKSEPMAMPLALCAPRIMVTGVFDDADGVYQYLKGFVGDEDAGDTGVAALANSLTEGCCDDDLAKIDTIASWVRQNIRYIGIEHGEYAHRPDEAASVLSKRYGDCKGSANLIKAMLRSVGVDGRLCWIGTYPQVDYAWEEFPGLGAGNHLIDKQLTVEYVTINGAPDFTTKDESGSRNQLAISLHGLPALKTDRYTNRMRQLPMVKIRTMNNTVKGLYRPKTTRGGCMYGNMGVDCYLTDIGSALMDQRYDAGNSIYGKAMGTLKSFRKMRPEAGRRELIDAAWLSLMYHNYISALNDEGSESPMMQSVMFKDMVEKSGLGNDDVSIAVINPRTDVAIQYISHWKEPDCAAVVGDSLYVFTSFGTYLPGELPERLQGEMGACFEGSREDYTQLSKLKYIETKTTFARHNKHELEMTASFADDGFEALNVNRKVKATGLYKGYLGLPQSLSGFMNSVGSYLGVKNVKVPKKFDLDEVEMKKQLDEALGDEAESFLGVRPKAIDGVDIESFGNIPGSPTAIFSAQYTLENMAQDMGDDVIVGVGKLFGDNVKVEGEERERELPAFMKLPNQVSRKLVLIVPEGYAADEESVALLNKNVTNSIGNFYTTARVNDEGNVELQCAERYNTFYVQPQLWSQYLEVSDAAADFNEAELVLHKKM